MKDGYLQAYLVEGAHFEGKWEFPRLEPYHEPPDDLIPFSKTKGKENPYQFVHFFEEDEKILPFGRDPRRYFPRLSQFKGIIGCDFSVCRDMPLSLQIGQTLRNRALTFWLQNHGLSVIPNVRFADERSYEFCFDGIPKNSVIAIGTHGWTQKNDDIDLQIKGIIETIKRLKPERIVFYGAVKPEIRFILGSEKTPYKIFPSDTSEYFRNKKEKSHPLFDDVNIGGA